MRQRLQNFSNFRYRPDRLTGVWVLLLFVLVLSANINSQSTANYTFTTSNTGSLVDMSSGTTTLLSGASLDDVASPVANIGFNFVLMGKYYTAFSVNSNGSMGLGSTQVATLGTSTGTTTAPRISPFGGDQAVITTGGKVHYKVTGTAPNRVLVVEWLNMKMNYTNYATALTGDGTYQALLYETMGKVEFIYGKMTVATAFSTGPVVGISAGTSANQTAAVTTSTNSKTDGTAWVNNTYTVGDIANLNSSADGSRRVYTFTPPATAPNAPSGLNFTSVGLSSMTLNWTDNSSDETGFIVYRSDDGGSSYNPITNLATGTVTYAATSLLPGTTYFWEVRGTSEGRQGDAATGSQATTTATFGGTIAIGPSGEYASITSALADAALQGLSSSAILELQSDYTSSSETLPLNITTIAGLSASRTITIRPATGVTGASISGSNTTAIVNLDGAKYITVDGRPGGVGTSRELTISNSGNGPSVRFINDASNNNLKYCNVVGAANTSNSSGVVLFSTTSGTTGNDNNTVEFCDINALGSACGITSNGTSGKENSDNVISNNNIRNFYLSATSATSTYGIRLTTGSTSFTISGNSLYQESARACTTAAVIHYGISCSNTSGNNFMVTNNHIGGNAPNSSGAYTLSSGSPRFWAIEINVGSTAVTSVQGNTIRGFDISSGFTTNGSTLFGGMVISAGWTYIGTETGNSIGSSSGNSITVSLTGSAVGAIIAGIVTTGGTPHSIQNNTIAGFTVSASSATAYANVFGVSLGASSAVTTASDNSIGSSSAPIINNSGTGAVTTQYVTSGIRVTAGSGTTGITIANNTVNYINMPAGSTNTGACVYGLQLASSGTVYTVTGNTIKNLTTGSARTNTGSGACLAGINNQGTTSPTVISGNKIYALSSTASSAAVVVYGAFISGALTGTFQFNSNEVHSLAVSSSSTIATLDGVFINSGFYRIFNNMIRVGIDTDGNSVSTNIAISGIRKSSTTAQTIAFNSIYVGGSVASSTINTFGLRRTGVNAADSLFNNIIVNNRTNSSGTANHYAIACSTATGLENNNVFYANGTGGKIGSVDNGTTPLTTLNDYKTAFSGRNTSSMAADPKFINATGNISSVNLHIMPSPTPTPVEGQGSTALNYFTTDFDGQTRSGLTPVDIGADAGDFTPLDISGPTITYTALTNTSNSSSRTLANVTITDNSGVDVTPGTAPRLYYKKSTNNNEFAGNTDADNGWKWVESGSGSSPFSFDIDYSIIFEGGVASGDVIEYFVVAQDMAGTPNVGINQGVLAGTPLSVDLQPDNAPVAGTIRSYTIIPNIAGEVLVGTGQTYTSLTGATGLFNAINNRVVTGNLSVKITSNLTEDGTVALNQTVEEAIYTITIQPDAATERLISGAVANGMIRFNGADGVVIDGRFGGSGSYLKFRNENTSNPVFTFLNSSSNNTIRNCVIEGASTSASNAVVFFSTGDNTGNQIIETQIRDLTTTAARPLYGVYFNSLTNNNNTIKNSSIFNFTTAGVYVNAGTNVTVESNLIYMTSASTAGTVTGVYAQNAPGLRVVKNKIYDLNGSSSAAIRGLYYGGVSGTSMIVTMENNLIQLSPSTTGTVDGVDYYGYSTNSLSMYFNSIYIGGTLASGTNGSYGIRKRDVALAFDLKNNVVQNARSNSGGTGSHYAIYASNTTVTTLSLNYNDYFTSGAGGVMSYWGSNKTTIEDWRTATSQDANSLNADPLFRASDNLQPFVGSPILAGGTPVSGITTDYTGTTRSATNPSIGAYETGFTPPGVDWANLQWPPTMSLKEGVKGDVYAQVYKAGVTEPAGQGAGISVWIGVSATNTNPNTWTNWTAATFNAQSGNNDEYTAQIGGTLAEGTYYYATRVLLEGGVYQYGGYNGGFWDGTTNVSGVLTVTDGVINFVNLQFPSTAVINEGGTATIYGRVYAEGVTPIAGGSPGIVCQIGWNNANTDPSTWSNWTTATFNAQFGNDDEYQATIGSGLTTGTYYYATRFKLVNDPYFYGGYGETGGGTWDGVANVSGVLTVNPFIANLPYIQNFDGVTAPALPAGWTVLDANSDTYKWSNAASNPKSSPNAMKAVYNSLVNTTAMDDWFFSPGINLQAGVEYEVIFYYRAESATFPEKLEVKWGTAANVAGMTGGTLFTNSSITNITYSKGSGSFTPSSSGVFYIGFHGFSAADMFNLYVDDILIRVKPSATNSQTIAGNNTSLFTFTGTGAQVQFTTGNTGSVTLQFEKIPGNPRGTLPSPVLNVANTYWTGTVTAGTVNGTYTLTLDLTGVPGIGNPATIHLLKRSDINGSWVDLGYPTDVSAFPLVSWANIASGFSDFGLGGENDNPLPVELVNFQAKAKNRNAILSWETKTEVDNSGFEVERIDKDGDWKKVTFIEGHGTSNSTKYYSFEDMKLSSGKHSYRLKQIDNDGTVNYSDIVEVEISLPTEFALSQNYPNPFNPSTKVDYQLAADSRVTIELYGITGERVAVLVNQEQEAGYYTMMIDSYTHRMASGIYIYRMIATDATGKNFVSTKKLSLLK